MSHWKTLFDPDDGEPYGVVCHCPRDFAHDGHGDPFPDDEPDDGAPVTEEPPGESPPTR